MVLNLQHWLDRIGMLISVCRLELQPVAWSTSRAESAVGILLYPGIDDAAYALT